MMNDLIVKVMFTLGLVFFIGVAFGMMTCGAG